MSTILDDVQKIKQLDSKNMLGSLEKLGAQIQQIFDEADGVNVPVSYHNCQQIVFLGMGGSTLGAHVIKAVFEGELLWPLEIVNNYHVPALVSEKSLVVVCSYSGTTEEPLAALLEAEARGAKILIITSGGALAQEAARLKVPALIFKTKNNPCGSPRMGLGYTLFGPAIILAKAGAVSFDKATVGSVVKTIARYQTDFGAGNPQAKNIAKQLAGEIGNRHVWYVGSSHLAGNVHVAANQMNENAKRFAGWFLVPELNHHLMEGMLFPKTNKEQILFILIESELYDSRIQKRFQVTKEILTKNQIPFVSYICQEKSRLEQAAEMLVLSSYLSYYSALLEGIDPTAIPFVDYFKAALKK